MTIVLDSSAALAYIFGESGGPGVEGLLDRGVVGAVNHAEIVTGVARRHGDGTARAILAAVAFPVIAADEAMAMDAGLLRPSTDAAGLSLGDRFCLALARRLSAPVLTADRAWLRVSDAVGVEVRLIR